MSLISSAARFVSGARPLAAAFGATALIILTAGTARADLKVVSKTTSGTTSSTLTTYYKGGKARIESGTGVIITDGAGKTYMLNPAQKTYSVMKPGDTAPSPAMDAMNMFDMSADVRPGGKTKTVLGKPVKNFVFTITMKPNAAFKARMAQAKQQNPNANIPDMATMVITIKGEEWVTDALGVGGAGNAAMMQQMNAMPNFRKIAQKFSIIKGVSLESNVTTNVAGRVQTSKTVATTISQSALSDSLFSVPPVGYKLQPLGAGMGGMRPGGGTARPGAPAPR